MVKYTLALDYYSCIAANHTGFRLRAGTGISWLPFSVIAEEIWGMAGADHYGCFFGLMHIGRMPFSEIMVTMFTTGIGALLFGLAYIKTKNLALPTGIHFG